MANPKDRICKLYFSIQYSKTRIKILIKEKD